MNHEELKEQITQISKACEPGNKIKRRQRDGSPRRKWSAPYDLPDDPERLPSNVIDLDQYEYRAVKPTSLWVSVWQGKHTGVFRFGPPTSSRATALQFGPSGDNELNFDFEHMERLACVEIVFHEGDGLDADDESGALANAVNEMDETICKNKTRE